MRPVSSRQITGPTRQADPPRAPRARKRVRADRPQGRSARSDGWRGLFPKLTRGRRRFGLGVTITIARREGAEWRVEQACREQAMTQPGGRPKARFLDAIDAKSVASLLVGLAHGERIRLVRSIATGDNTHARLKAATQLQAGPLYHHLRELERAGIVERAARSFYVLTDAGERLLLLLATLGGRNGPSVWKSKPLSPIAGRRKGPKSKVP